MKIGNYIIITLFVTLVTVRAESHTVTAPMTQDTLKYRIYLTDKSATTYSLQHPEAFLSLKALERRARQHLRVDSTDLPVCAEYIKTIREEGLKIVAVGKWNNFVTVSCNNRRKIEKVKRLPFVRSTELVWRGPKYVQPENNRDTLLNVISRCDTLYGPAFRQIQLCNGDKLQKAGYRGQGMTIAVIDAGFQNEDSIAAMHNVKVLGARDFVNPHGDVYVDGTHGMSVLSILSMNKPYFMIGSAPEASYWLLRSEDESSENLVEQDYWSEAIEFADSVGVDLVNSSLGYYEFDDSSKNYKYCDLDGQTALISREASMVADKGMILVVSAGNAGAGSWKKISTPADADNILAVGAVDYEGQLASYSSVGNTADGRIKPDVVAMGYLSAIMSSNGVLVRGNGTSFASPLVCGLTACLWQACPQLTAKQIMNVVRRSGNRAGCPDNVYGNGIPDMWQALQTVRTEK